MTCLPSHLQQFNYQILIFENNIPTERKKLSIRPQVHIAHLVHCSPIVHLLFISFNYSKGKNKQRSQSFFCRLFQNTPPLICISMKNNSIYCYLPRSSKHTDTCNGWAGIFCNRSLLHFSNLQFLVQASILHMIFGTANVLNSARFDLISFPRGLTMATSVFMVSSAVRFRLIFHWLDLLMEFFCRNWY